MPRDRKEIWSPAKRSIIGEWRNWAKSDPRAAAADDAFDTFYLQLLSMSGILALSSLCARFNHSRMSSTFS